MRINRKKLWDSIPSYAKSGIGLLVQHVPIRLFLGKEFRGAYSFVKEAQWWTADKAREYQLEQIKRVCVLAEERSSYYRNLFKKAGFDPRRMKSIEEFKILPLLDKATVNNHINDMVTVPIGSNQAEYITTGGTSGIPLNFYTTPNRSATEYAYLVNGWERAGFSLGDTMAVFRGKVVNVARDGIYHEFDPLLRHHYYSNFHMSENDMTQYLSHVSGIGKCFLHVYPSSVAALARFVRRKGVEPPENILGVLAESENIYQEQRAMVEDVFKKRYFSSYGHTEKLVAAAECEYSTAYHVWPTYGYMELIDDNGAQITTPGGRGEIVGTGFINGVTPFIRYKTGDYATYVADKCQHCGREHMIIKDIRGHRTQEYLVAHNMSQISWTAINMHDDTFDNVLRFQFYQDTPGLAVLRLVVSEKFTDLDKERIAVNLGRKLKGMIDFSIELVDEIKLTQRGKSIYVEQKINLHEVQ